MGTITATSIINKAAIQLIDTSTVRWTRDELLGWINDAQRQIVLAQPNSNNVVVATKLVAGTRQRVPSDGWLLLDVYRNMGTSGTTPGAPVREISRRVLDSFRPTWHSETAVTAVTNYLFDLQDQTSFYVYPPADGTGYLEINYSAQPADLTAESQSIVLYDTVEPAILAYTLAMAFGKDAEFAGNAAMAKFYMDAFQAALGAKDKAEQSNDPVEGLFARDPGRKGGSS